MAGGGHTWWYGRPARQRREECEARATLERHRGAFGAPGRPLGRVRRRSAAHELLPKMSASQRVVRCTRE